MKRIDHRRNYFMVIDTETANGLDAPLVYDLGLLIIDSKGKIYERRSYIVAEIFYGENDLMKTAYYAKKLPQYHKGVLNGEWDIKPFFAIRREVLALMDEYKPTALCAYNASFDFYRALNNTMRYLLNKEKAYFLPYGTEIWDIWTMACHTLLCQKPYDALAYKNQWVSEKGNVLTNAQVAYAYITGDEDFEEQHTALSDCEIEAAILLKCLKLRAKERKVEGFPWRIPQPPYKEYVAMREGL